MEGTDPILGRLVPILRRSQIGAFGVVLALAVTLGVLCPAPTVAQTDGVSYDRFDVALELRADGTFHVVETQVVSFAGGPFKVGFRSIPLERVEAIRNVQVGELVDGALRPYAAGELDSFFERPERYASVVIGSSVFVSWSFPPTTNGGRTFVVEYDVVGALRVYPDEEPPNQQIWWTAVGAELTEENAVGAARTTVRLPRPVALDRVVLGADGRDDPGEHSADGQTFAWERGRIPRGESFEVRLQFPPLVDVPPPSWQAADDERRAREAALQRQGAARDLLFLGVGLALVTGGGIGAYGAWYLRGRDPDVGHVADFRTRPPDDLPPGAAGALLDERADEQDIVATLLDLSRRGVLAIAEERTPGVLGVGGGRDFTVTVVADPTGLAPLDDALVRALFGERPAIGEAVRLSAVHARFVAAYPWVKERLYQELVGRGYFPRSPEATRRRWRRAAALAVGAAIVAGAALVGAFGGLAWLPPVIAGALAVAAFRLGGAMPRKSAAGAAAAARWRAFRRYLAEIERYEPVAEARQIFDRYLPYAVAFGLERSWVRTFAAAGAETPRWYNGSGSAPDASGGDWGDLGDLRLPRGGGRGVDLPDPPSLRGLQAASDRGGRSLQGSSDGFFALLNIAAAVFDVFAGGGRSGGASGGGGGGFR